MHGFKMRSLAVLRDDGEEGVGRYGVGLSFFRLSCIGLKIYFKSYVIVDFCLVVKLFVSH